MTSNHCRLKVSNAVFILLYVFMLVQPASTCGPVHQWKAIVENEKRELGARAGFDIAVGLLDSLREELGVQPDPFRLSIIELTDFSEHHNDSLSTQKLETALQAAADEDPGFSLVASRTLADYLKEQDLTPSRLINPSISTEVASALGFDALIWFGIRSYSSTGSRCLDLLERENTVFADVRKQEAVVRVKVVDARTASIIWIDELAGEYSYQNIYLVHDLIPFAGEVETVANTLTAKAEEGEVSDTAGETVEMGVEKPITVPPLGISIEILMAGTTSELFVLTGLTSEIVQGSENYQHAYRKNRYWQPHEEDSD